MNVTKTWSHHTGPPESGHGYLDELMERAKSATVRNVAKSTDYLPMTWYTEEGDGKLAGYIADMQETEQDDRMLAPLKERFRRCMCPAMSTWPNVGWHPTGVSRAKCARGNARIVVKW